MMPKRPVISELILTSTAATTLPIKTLSVFEQIGFSLDMFIVSGSSTSLRGMFRSTTHSIHWYILDAVGLTKPWAVSDPACLRWWAL
ncbi:unnamed protein product [Phytophthora fragariaefolia]|uniref:Unnamed protein product n=1 Tax=Phytophthora fragariaefolia TaxID=1490495 RepID=A0A9W6U2W0_9STRA|nr:unnamed protein product [Phytophthora fragariaefolia]